MENLTKYKKCSKSVLSALLVIIMVLGLAPIALAEQVYVLPLEDADGKLVADRNTRYITEVEQDPVSKMITVTVKITNGSNRTMYLEGVCFVVAYDGRKVAPYRYDPTDLSDKHTYSLTRMFVEQTQTSNKDIFLRYVYATGGHDGTFTNFGATVVSNMIAANPANDESFIGGKVCGGESGQKDALLIAANTTMPILQVFFMPVDPDNGKDILEASMFKLKYNQFKLTKVCSWIGNSTNYLYASDKNDDRFYYKYYIDEANELFKMNFIQQPPTGITADLNDRVVVGYDNATMEWSNDGITYRTGVPVVPKEGCTYYFRFKEVAHPTDNAEEYGDYKRSTASLPFVLDFPADKCAPFLTKTSRNVTLPVGEARVGDVIEYKIIAGNDGVSTSSWTGAKFTDVIPEGTTFDNTSVTVDGVAKSQGTGFTFTSNTLTIELGNIMGKTQRVIIFNVKVNDSAYGKTIINSVSVKGTNGSSTERVDLDANDGGSDGKGGIKVIALSAKPAVNEVTHGDTTISGTGVPGADIEVTLNDGTKLPVVKVASNGTWTAPVPAGKEPTAAQKVSAVQTETNKAESPKTEVTVVARPAVVKQNSKASANITMVQRGDGKWRVGDTVRYTITVKNNGLPKSLWENATITDTLPTQVNFVPGTVKVDAVAVSDNFNSATKTLTVNLGNIPGGITKTVTFDAIINDTAYGKQFKNTAKVDGVDVTETTNPPAVVDRSQKPVINDVNEGDKTIAGTGVPGATVSVTLPTGNVITTTVGPGPAAVWSINVPQAVNLVKGDTVKAVQKEEGLEESLPAETIIQEKTSPIMDMEKTSRLISKYTDGLVHVGDTIEYTVKVKNTVQKSVLTDAKFEDTLPDGVTLSVTGNTTVRVNNVGYQYIYANRKLEINLGDIAYGADKTIVFSVTIDNDAHSKTIKNSASVAGFNNGDTQKPINAETTEPGDGHKPIAKSAQPTVQPVTREDKVIKGKGVPGATITITLPDGVPFSVKIVSPTGDWTAEIPAGKLLPDTNDEIYVIQTEPNKDASDPVKIIVGDKQYRAVTGIAAPMVIRDVVPGFRAWHPVTAELRRLEGQDANATRNLLKLSKSVGLTNVAALFVNSGDTGRFTIENVPFGTYVLVITRPGYVTRAMKVIVSASDPDIITVVTPSYGNENGVFRLWAGDCNGSHTVDVEDVMWITEYIKRGVNIDLPSYDAMAARADLNADGDIDSLDLAELHSMWDRMADQYAGSETGIYY